MHRRPLRSHTSDVTDVAWSPDSERVASASVDNCIIVWSLRTESAIVRLDGHKGFIKGLAWDPIGRFLASQSDDRTVRIWRTSDWKTDKVISQPFETAVFQENTMTFFLRISWAPCGSHLIATNAYRKPGIHHAPLFSRHTGFDDPIEFVGHREPVISSRFSPRLYRPHPKMKEKSTANGNAENGNAENSKAKSEAESSATYTVLSLGSKDGGCTIWQARAVRPFVEMYDAFDMEVIDMAWATDGYTFTACSTDGKVLYMRFEPEELGNVVPIDETRKILAKIWRSFGGSAATADTPLPESAIQLDMEERHAQAKAQVQYITDEKGPNAASLVAPVSGTTPAAAPNSKLTTVPATIKNGTSTPQQSRIAQSSGLLPSVFASTEAVLSNGPTPPADPKVMAAQAETRVRGGKRRITPISVSAVDDAPIEPRPPTSGPTAPPPAPIAHHPASSFQPMAIEVSETVPAVAAPTKRPRTSSGLDDTRPVDGYLGAFARSESASAAAAAVGGTSRQPTSAGAGSNGCAALKTPAMNGTMPNGSALHAEQKRLGLVPPGATPVSHAAHLYAPSVVGLSMMLLPSRGNEGPGRCRILQSGDATVMLESREQIGGGGGYAITCSANGKVRWKDYHSKTGAITALAGVYGKFVTAGSADAMLYLYSANSGRRLAPPIALDSAPYMLEAFWFGHDTSVRNGGMDAMVVDDVNEDDAERWFVMVISRSAMCSVYDVRAKRLVCARSAASLLARPLEQEIGSSNKASDGDKDTNNNNKLNNNSNNNSHNNNNASTNNIPSNQSLQHSHQEANGGSSNRARIIREVSHCDVTRDGEPIVALSDGHVFVYSRDFCAWLRVADDSLPNSDFRRTITGLGGKNVGLVRSLQSRSGATALMMTKGGHRNRKAPSTLSGMGDLQRAAVESLAHLEVLMETAVSLHCADDYRYYLTSYAASIASAVDDDVEGCTVRLHEVCDLLLNAKHPHIDPIIAGLSGRRLLRDHVLPIVSKNRHLQRVVGEYSDGLKEMDNFKSASGT